MDYLTRQDVILELLLKSKQEMFGDRMGKGNLDYRNCEIMELKMLTEVTKSNSYNIELMKYLSFLVI